MRKYNIGLVAALALAGCTLNAPIATTEPLPEFDSDAEELPGEPEAPEMAEPEPEAPELPPCAPSCEEPHGIYNGVFVWEDGHKTVGSVLLDNIGPSPACGGAALSESYRQAFDPETCTLTATRECAFVDSYVVINYELVRDGRYLRGIVVESTNAGEPVVWQVEVREQ